MEKVFLCKVSSCFYTNCSTLLSMATTIGHNLQPMVHGTTTQKEHDTSTQTSMTHDSIFHMYIFYKYIFLNYKERYWVYEHIQLPDKKPKQFLVIQAQRAAIQSQSLATVMATLIESKACKSGLFRSSLHQPDT